MRSPKFKVLTSNYGAQYGRNGSGTVEVETKSGTSSFHGDAYEFVRNDIFNATTYFQSSVPAVQEERFRIYHRRPGFYSRASTTRTSRRLSSSGRRSGGRERVPANLGSVIVPSLAERGGDFSDLCPRREATARE